MKYRKSLATVACVGLVILGVSTAHAAAPPSPLKVTLTANPCPIVFAQGSVALKAQITGGYQPTLGHLLFVMTRYTFSAQAGGVSSVIKENIPDAAISWIPNLPGSYVLSVTVKQTQGGGVAQATAVAQCEVKKLAYQVTLNVSPPSGQAQAPPPSDAKKMIVSASVSPALPNATNAFSFVVQKMNSGVVALNTIRVNRSDASWPADPPQPADPGLYRIAVQVVGYVTFPQGDIVVAEGQKEINYYEAKPAKPFANLQIHTPDFTKTNATPVPASQVSLTVTPLSPSPSTSSIALTAAVAVPGNPSGVTNKFTFSYVPSAGGQPVSQVLPPTSGASQSWTLSPQPAPGTYTLRASVETRRTTDNTLMAQGSAQIANYVVAGAAYPFGWLFPVTTQNTTLAVGTKYGSATNTIAGNSISAIASQQVRVRADNSACAQCHSFGKSDFCTKAPNYLSKGPHASSGQAADQTLGSLFTNWTSRNCPD